MVFASDVSLKLYYIGCMPLPPISKKFKLCESVLELSDIGVGFPLFFTLKKYFIMMFFFMFLFVGCWTMIVNILADRGGEWADDKKANIFTKTSLGNHGKKEENYESAEVTVQPFFHLGVIVLNLMFCIYIRIKILRTDRKLDEQTIKPSDFWVMISNIPKETTLIELDEYLKETFQATKIEKVIFSYEIYEIVENIRKKQKLKNLIEQKIRSNENIEKSKETSQQKRPNRYLFCWWKKHDSSLGELEEKLKIAEDNISNYKGKLGTNVRAYPFTGIAFVIFNHQSDVTKVIQHYKISRINRIFRFIAYKIWRWRKIIQGDQYFGANRLYAHRAPEPTDILWENLNIKTYVKFKYSVYVYLATFVLLSISFLIHFFINQLKDSIENDAAGGNNTSSVPYNGIRFLAFLLSLLVVLVNFLLGKIIRLFSSYQKLGTYSEYHLTVATQLSIGMFINTGIVPLVINNSKQNWFNASGLVVDVFFNTIGISFISPLTYALDPMYIFKWWQRRRAEKKQQKANISQHKLNTLYEGAVLDMAQRYSNLMLLFMITVFYTPLIPITPFITGWGALIEYWIEKYMLLNVHNRPETLGSFMPNLVASSLPPFMIIYGVSNYIFLRQLKGSNLVGLISIIIPAICMFFPFRLLARKWVEDVKRSEKQTYNLNMLDFNFDYDRENPVTDEQATMKYLEKIDREANIEKLEMIRRQTMIHFERDTLANYANRRTIVDRAKLYLNHRMTSNMQAFNVI
jgi:hypothetical protein